MGLIKKILGWILLFLGCIWTGSAIALALLEGFSYGWFYILCFFAGASFFLISILFIYVGWRSLKRYFPESSEPLIKAIVVFIAMGTIINAIAYSFTENEHDFGIEELKEVEIPNLVEYFTLDIYEEKLPYSKASGLQVCLVNYKNATDPTWGELIAFLQSDDTDGQPYIEDSFVCADFAEMLHNNAEASGIKAAWVAVDFEFVLPTLVTPPLVPIAPYNFSRATDKKLNYGFSFLGEGHALNAFNTTDKGLVYVDCTRGFSSPIIVELTDSAKREGCEHDKIAYVVEGKEYGLISIDKATSPEYWFYEEYTKKWEVLEKDIAAYNSDVEVYNNDVKAYEGDVEAYERTVGGRTYISDHEEYERLNKMYNELKGREKELDIRGNELDARRDRLDERQEELGNYRWEPLGVVTDVEVYW